MNTSIIELTLFPLLFSSLLIWSHRALCCYWPILYCILLAVQTCSGVRPSFLYTGLRAVFGWSFRVNGRRCHWDFKIVKNKKAWIWPKRKGRKDSRRTAENWETLFWVLRMSHFIKVCIKFNYHGPSSNISLLIENAIKSSRRTKMVIYIISLNITK